MTVAAPSAAGLQRPVQQMATRIGRSLERCGLIVRDLDNAWRAFRKERRR